MALLDDAFALITSGTRQIGTLMPDVVIREINKDELVVTDHPVERGAAISDHAFMRPSEIEMQVAWSDSTAGYVGYCRDVYEQFLALQKKREPFNVSTGKRSYKNMLVSSLAVSTDEKTENILLVSVRLREVIMVSTQTTGSPKSVQANPAKTGATTQTGTQQLKSSGTSGFASPSARA
ncbi:phage baseplate protein [Bosea sp. 2KB_26]|uniref:phage baseplate protein n=1 Tax=Bosea sp. 2KB_26 TaxID=3237475 RepID=UPI003F8EAC3A